MSKTKFLKDTEFEDFITNRYLSDSPEMDFILRDGNGISSQDIDYRGVPPIGNVTAISLRHRTNGKHKVELADILQVLLIPEGQSVFRHPPPKLQ